MSARREHRPVAWRLTRVLFGLGAAACVWGCSRLGGRHVPATLSIYAQDTYRARSGLTKQLYILTPSKQRGDQATPRTHSPALILFHGGDWTGGGPAELAGYGPLLARRGFVVVLPEYRAQPREAMENARAAVEAVQENAAKWGIDSRRVVVGGGSAGGHVAFFAAVDAVRRGQPLAGLVLLSSVTDMTRPESGEAAQRFGREAAPYSPTNHVSAALPPTLIVHGVADDVTRLQGATLLEAVLREVGVPVELQALDGVGHGFYAVDLDRSPRPPWVELMVRWIESRVSRVTPQ